MDPPSMEPPAFIHPGGLHGEEKRYRSRFTPRRAQRRQDISAVMFNAELVQVRVRLRAAVKAVGTGRIVAGPNASAANREPQARRSEEFGKQRLPLLVFKLRKPVAGCIGEGGAKTEDLLVAHRGIELNTSRSAGGRGMPLRCFDPLEFAVLRRRPALYTGCGCGPKR